MVDIVFGEDGNDVLYDVGNTTIYDEPIITVPIKNNSDKVLCAYVYIDYNYSGDYKYFEIATVSGGPYTDTYSGEVFGPSNVQRWYAGVDNNTSVSMGGVKVITGNNTGIYTSPVFSPADEKLITFMCSEITDTPNVTANLEIRSSDIKPALIEEIYFCYGGGLHRDIINGTSSFSGWPISVSNANCVCVSEVTGKVVLNYSTTLSVRGTNGSQLVSYSASTKTQFRKMEYRPGGTNFWGYSPSWGGFVYLNDVTLGIISEYRHPSQADFVTDFSVARDGVGLWYIDSITSRIIRIDNKGEEVYSKGFTNLTALCATNDGGCWVADEISDEKTYVYRFGGSNEAMEYVTLSGAADLMCDDGNDGFWYTNSETLYHLDADSYVETLIGNYHKASFIKAFNNKLILHSDSLHVTTVIDNNGFVMKTLYGTTSTDCCMPDMFYMTNTDQVLPDDYVYPMYSDTTWGANDASLVWKSFNNGNILSRKKYHQIKASFTTDGGFSDTILRRVVFQPSIKVGNLQPQEYKNVYVRPKFDAGDTTGNYNANIKVRWEEVE